jgi:tetratricopeptide (TPR) repeat protein
VDKFEYKIRSEEIRTLIGKGDYASAVMIADRIDWRRVKSVIMLCQISDLYKITRRYEEAKDLLLLAYDRHPGGRGIVYSLCELSIKMENFVDAVEYYKEFVQIAPKDTSRYILQYKLYEAQDVSIEERIAVLEEFKAKDYREKWAYELAYLYHRIGLATRCVEECDELILLFGEGKYVVKAMELKMLHQPLTATQQIKYINRFSKEPIWDEPESILDDVVDASQVSNDQYPEMNQERVEATPSVQNDVIQVHTVDIGAYNTLNLQRELAEGLKDVLQENMVTPSFAQDTDTLDAPVVEEIDENALIAEEVGETEVFFQETEGTPEQNQLPASQIEGSMREVHYTTDGEVVGMIPQRQETLSDQAVSRLEGDLSMESDGQIRLLVPETGEKVKQITGQISIDEVLHEWERIKLESETRRTQELTQQIQRQTGPMFTEFEAAIRDGLLEKLESEPLDDLEVELLAVEPNDYDSSADQEEREYLQKVIEASPEEMAILHEEIESLPEEPETVHEEIEALPEELGTVHEEIEAFPEEPETVHEEIESFPEEPETVHEEIEALPAESGVLHEVIETMPEEIVSTPEEIAIIPEEMATMPEEMATMPEEMASTPEEMVFISEDMEVSQGETKSEPPRTTRSLTPVEKDLYTSFIQSKTAREQLVNVIDQMNHETKNHVILTAEEGLDILSLAKNLIRQYQAKNSALQGKVATIQGSSLNNKNIEKLFEQIKNGALIIQKVSRMNADIVDECIRILAQEDASILLILEDTPKAMRQFISTYADFARLFPVRMNVESLSNDSLVAFGRKYALEREYTIDELGILALHTRIEERQTSEHVVTVLEVKDIVDAAIRKANRVSVRHFFDILLAKRFDDQDMIRIGEKEFILQH